MTSTENPFEVFDIDPQEGPSGITERFKELIEDVVDENEKTRLRQAWEQLTAHPETRVLLALQAHPKGTALPKVRSETPLIKKFSLTLASLIGMPKLSSSLSLTTNLMASDTLADDPAFKAEDDR